LLRHRIEVSGLETETTTTYANPDGSLTTDASSAPIREQVHGAWQPVDTTLVPVPGGFAPKVSALPVVFSAGQGTALNRVKLSGEGVSVGWPGRLPAPTVEGDTATYHDVEPGVDLVLTAGVTGYESSIVLTRRPSAAVSFSLPIITSGLAVTQDANGSLRYSDSSGQVALVSNQPVMWGAEMDPAAAEPTRTAAVPSTLSKGLAGLALTVRPSAAFLADPSVAYPVTIDPPSSLTSAHYMYTTSLYRTASNFDNSQTENGVTGVTHVGTYDSGTDSDRAFYQFSTSAIAGASVVSRR
jgi:hypothetical protein